jgi:hypothetical protein
MRKRKTEQSELRAELKRRDKAYRREQAWLKPMPPAVQVAWMEFKRYLAAGDTEQAFMQGFWAGYAAGAKEWYDKLAPLWVAAATPEAKRKGKRKANKQAKMKMAQELWAEYDPSDVKTRGQKAVHREIGEVMQQRLKLPKPIPAETVRTYLM